MLTAALILPSFFLLQRLASDFLSNYIFLTVGRVGSSTDLIAQRVELVQDMDKRSLLMDLLRSQKANGIHGKVLWSLAHFDVIFLFNEIALVSLVHLTFLFFEPNQIN